MKQKPKTSLRIALGMLAVLAALVGAQAASASESDAALAPVAAAAAAKPALRVGSSTMPMGDAAGRMFKGLVYTVAALGLALSLVKRIKGSPKKSQPMPIDVVARRNLSSRVSLVVVEVEGRRLLLSQGPEEARLITELGMSRDDFENLLGSDEGFIEELPRAVHE